MTIGNFRMLVSPSPGLSHADLLSSRAAHEMAHRASDDSHREWAEAAGVARRKAVVIHDA
jgi:hypothetical protein